MADAVGLAVEAAVHQAINNWDGESAQLFSLIQRQRKADKFNQYRGDGMEFSEVELQYLGEANKEDELKICNQSCKELGSGCGCDIAIEDDSKDWFRNGDLPPIGEAVNAHWTDGANSGARSMSVIGVYGNSECKMVWLVDDAGFFKQCELSMVFPKGYNLDGLHEEATKENERINSCMRSFLEISELLKKISASGRVSMDAEVIAEYLVDYGCRCHPELAE